jgi:hypothetical protein
LEVDGYDSTHELLAIIRGSDGGKKMYGSGGSLPDVYTQHYRTELYSNRVVYPGSWNKLAEIAHEDDHVTILREELVRRAQLPSPEAGRPLFGSAVTGYPVNGGPA